MDKITGTCHCGAVAFTVPAETDFTSATRCDCSLCRRRWVPTASVPMADLDVIKGREVLDCYQWNTKVAAHYYCTTCHVYVFHRRRSDPNEYGVNPGCFENVDMRSLRDTEITDGINHPADR